MHAGEVQAGAMLPLMLALNTATLWVLGLLLTSLNLSELLGSSHKTVAHACRFKGVACSTMMHVGKYWQD